MIRLDRKTVLAILLPFGLIGCGGGGGSSSPTASAPPAPVAAAPDEPTIVKIGPITGFGSVFVDGERFETSSTDTDYLKDDDVAEEDEFEIGMIVKVRGSSKNAAGEWIADDVEFDEDVKGPIDSINGTTLVVLGQTIDAADARIDDGLAIGDFAPGDILEISGNEVLGLVRDLDLDNQEFSVGDLRIRYGVLPAILDDLDGGLAENILVEVEDSNLSYMPGDGFLIATKVEGERRAEFRDEDDNDFDEDEDEFEIEAVISEIIDDNTFMLGLIQVTHDGSTEFSGGTVADLAVGVLVDVDGDLTASGVHADEIEFENNEARISGLINEIDEDNNRITVMGVVVELEGAELRDSLEDVEPLSVTDLMPNQFVDLRGSESNDVIRAEELERDDSDDDSEMRGMLDGFDDTAFTVTIFNQVINTDAQTRYECDDAPVSRDEFFARLHAGQSVVDADWDGAFADTSMPVEELSLED
jgi:hypothetical protein